MIPTRAILLPAIVAACIPIAGCNSSIVTITGQVTKNGEPLKPARGQRLRIVFYNVTEGTGKDTDPYLANVPPDGSFMVPGRRGKGIPAGKYKISVQLLVGGSGPHGKDQLNEVYSPANTSIAREFTRSEHITLDVGNPSG